MDQVVCEWVKEEDKRYNIREGGRVRTRSTVSLSKGCKVAAFAPSLDSN